MDRCAHSHSLHCGVERSLEKVPGRREMALADGVTSRLMQGHRGEARAAGIQSGKPEEPRLKESCCPSPV